MTVDTTSGNTVAPWEGDAEWASAGLEDVGAGDIVLPRLRINHQDGTFVDNLSNTAYNRIEAVILGMVKQRILWDSSGDIAEGQKPQCKSNNAVFGIPNMRKNAAPEEQFPWDDSNFDPSQLTTVAIPPSTDPRFPEGWNSNGYGILPCDSCAFKEWGRDKRGKSVPPLCSEQHTYILMYRGDESQPWTTALLTVQKTGIKPSKSYISSFQQRKQPMFTVVTELTLEQESRGTVTYAVPKFRTLGGSDRAQWDAYWETVKSVRTFVRSAPPNNDDDSAPVAPSDNRNTAPAATPASAATPAPAPAPVATPAAPEAPATPTPAAAAPAPAPAPVPADDDDDLPF